MRSLSSAKPQLGIADGANDSGFQVFVPADIIKHVTAHWIEQHPVDGEVAAQTRLPRGS